MRPTDRLTDEAIRSALTLDPAIGAPAGLAEAVRTTIDRTPQRRGVVTSFVPALASRPRMPVRLAIALGLLLLIAALLAAGMPRTPRAAVGTFGGGPARDGVMPGPAPSGVPVVAWGPVAVGPMGPWSPAVVDGVVFNADARGAIVALDLASGELIWDAEIGAPVNSGISVAGGLALVGDVDGVIHALDARDGSERWTYDAGDRLSGPPAVVDGIAYVGTVDGSLHAVRLSAGERAWPAPVRTAGPVGRAVAVGDGLVLVGSAGRTPDAAATLAAYDAGSGALRWSRPLQAGSPSTPAVADGLVFVTGGLDTGTEPSRADAFHVATGTPAWSAPFISPSGGQLYRAAVEGGRLFLLSSDLRAYALDTADGSVLWETAMESGDSPNGALVDDLLVITGSGRSVLALDPVDGRTLWRVPLEASARAPAIIDGAIVVGTDAGTLLGLRDPAPAGSPMASAGVPGGWPGPSKGGRDG